MTVEKIAHPSADEREAAGRAARDRVPLPSHARWRPAAGRPDPVALAAGADHPGARLGAGSSWPDDGVAVYLLPGRGQGYGGGSEGHAGGRAEQVQLCGDAHLSNFGVFASPERILLFDVNDFDETLPGPFEYDVERMAASFVVAGRNNGFSKADWGAAAQASVRAYREAMASFAQMGTMDIWYARIDEDELQAAMQTAVAGTAKEDNTAKKQDKADRREKASKKQKKQEKTAGKDERQAARQEKTARKASQ